jgi:hypothetical protein
LLLIFTPTLTIYNQVTNKDTALIGIPINIQFAKFTSTSLREEDKDANMALGGVPISVAKPPRLAEYAMESIRHNPNCFLCTGLVICSITADAIGTISIAVAVLLIHALKKPVIIMNAATMFLGLVPKTLKIFKANLLCSSVFSMALARINPPRKRNTILSA